MMPASTQWQLTRDAAERYDEVLVPTILGPAAKVLVDWAALQARETVVDVGCGTGAATRFAAERVRPRGRVIAVDVNPAMIDVAKSRVRNHAALIEWHVGDGADLPLADAAADAVLCAQTLQFIADKSAALREMHRVLKPGDGRVAVSTWCEIEENPYFRALVDAVAEHVGPETAAGLDAAFALASPSELHALLEGAGFRDVDLKVTQLDLRLPPLDEFVPRHIAATPMAAGLAAPPPAAREAVVEAVLQRLKSHEDAAGALLPFRTHLAFALKQRSARGGRLK